MFIIKKSNEQLVRYLSILSRLKQVEVNRIISKYNNPEQRWIKLKQYFIKTNPSLIDNLYAWNLYKSSI
jgi:hypothetical protein